MVHPIVRLLPGVSREQAQAELDSLFPPKAPYAAARGSFVPYLDDIRSNMNLAGGPIGRFLVAAAALVMLLGCANLAGMLLVRSRREERETAIRTALGASRLRVIRPVVLEGVFVGVAGSALAVVVTAFTSDALIAQVPSAAYGNIPVGVDHRVIFISLGLGVVGGLIFAGVPAWRGATADVLTVVQGRHHRSSATGRRAGWPLVMTQIALAIVLVCGAVMATKALITVLRVPLGFNPDDVVTLSLAGAPEGVDVTSFYRTVLEEIASRGDVVAAGAVATLPVTSSPFSGEVQLGSSDYPVGVYLIWPGYFEAAGIVPIRGRTLDWSDATSGAMAVFSESAARTIFGDRDPIGHMYGNGRGDQWQVVGVVPDVRHDLAREGRPAIYQVPDPDSRSARFPMTIVVRTRMRTGAIVGDLKKQLYAMAPGSAIRAAWWSDTTADVTAIRNPRFQTLVLSSFAGMALGLTALGVFGVVAFLVVSRSKEVALRMAIGAQPGALVLLMIRQALLPVVAGVALGLLAMQLLSGPRRSTRS